MLECVMKMNMGQVLDLKALFIFNYFSTSKEIKHLEVLFLLDFCDMRCYNKGIKRENTCDEIFKVMEFRRYAC